jgi:hypothetical protein
MKQVRLPSVGDRVEIIKEGALAHRRHHDDQVDVVAKVSTPLVRTAAEIAKQIVFTFPEPGFKGTVVEVRERWFGQSGYDYLVKWDECSGQSWYLSKHIFLIE